MNKLAVFVEGYTEVVFVEKLIEEIAGEAHVLIEHREIRGGSSARRTFARVRAAKPDTGQKYFVMIVDSGGDRLVKERIMEEHENLTKNGYTKIIGLRDVRPDFTHTRTSRGWKPVCGCTSKHRSSPSSSFSQSWKSRPGSSPK